MQWIKIEDMEPQPGVRCILHGRYWGRGRLWTGTGYLAPNPDDPKHYEPDQKHPHDIDPCVEPTHWMPLPEPPQCPTS